MVGDLKFEGQDIPTSGKPLLAYLNYITLNEVKLDLSECFCRMMAYQGQVSAQAQPDAQITFSNVKGRLEGKVTFPKPGPYIVIVMGRPLPGKTLPAFILTALIVVEPGS